MGYPLLRVRARDMAIGLFMASIFSTAALAQSDKFCLSLQRVIAEKPRNFMPLKAGLFHKATKEWDTKISLPDTQFCRIDIVAKNYNCWVTGLSNSWTIAEAEKFKSRISACLPRSKSLEKNDETRETTRTIIGWDAGEGVRVELVTRIGKQKPQRNSIFIYVE